MCLYAIKDDGTLLRSEKYIPEKMEEDHRGTAHRSHLQLLEEEMKVAARKLYWLMF